VYYTVCIISDLCIKGTKRVYAVCGEEGMERILSREKEGPSDPTLSESEARITWRSYIATGVTYDARVVSRCAQPYSRPIISCLFTFYSSRRTPQGPLCEDVEISAAAFCRSFRVHGVPGTSIPLSYERGQLNSDLVEQGRVLTVEDSGFSSRYRIAHTLHLTVLRRARRW